MHFYIQYQAKVGYKPWAPCPSKKSGGKKEEKLKKSHRLIDSFLFIPYISSVSNEFVSVAYIIKFFKTTSE